MKYKYIYWLKFFILKNTIFIFNDWIFNDMKWLFWIFNINMKEISIEIFTLIFKNVVEIIILRNIKYKI